MFWKFNLLTTSKIDTLIDKEEVTLHELMDEDDILQECKGQNMKLIEFLVKPVNMEAMVRLITEEPDANMDEKVRFKYPNTACELLTSDVTQINDALAGNEELIKSLYSFLNSEKMLNPLLASFFSKVMGLLITRKSEMIFDFLKSRENFVAVLLKHIGTSAIMDLLLRLLTCIESPDIRKAMVEWLNQQQIVEKLVSSLVPSMDEDIHCNAAQSLCDIIRLGREQLIQLQDKADPYPLLTTVEREQTVADLLEKMLSGERNESVMVNGLSVIQTLLDFKKQGPEDSSDQVSTFDSERMFLGVNNVLTAITPRLKDFHNVLLDPPKQRFALMPTTFGPLEPPLGNTRLQIARLITSLVQTNTHSVNVEFAKLGTIEVLMDLYFKYIWNNFLHSHVTMCIYTILNNPSKDVDGQMENPLLDQLFSGGRLIRRLVDVWEQNEQEQTREGGRRRGYMGHLTRMANDIVQSIEKGENKERIKGFLEGVPEQYKKKWEGFLSGDLAETNKKNTVELVRGHPLASSSEDDDPDFRDIPFPQDTAMQQLQQMTSNFIDQFGFNEEEFGEQEDKIDSAFTERISSIDFGINANEDNRPNLEKFEQACNEKLQQFDDNDSDEDIWEEKEITFAQKSQQKRTERLPVTGDEEEVERENSEDSTDSEEELDSPKRIVQQPVADNFMDIDVSEESGPVAMDTTPWDSNPKTKETQENWVDFSNKKEENWTDFSRKNEAKWANFSNKNEEKWAEFSSKVPQDAEENWADFSNFSNIEGCNPRSSSPVAMDTTETSSRTNAYLATEDKSPDIVLQSVDSLDEISTDLDSSEKTDASPNQSASDSQNNHVSQVDIQSQIKSSVSNSNNNLPDRPSCPSEPMPKEEVERDSPPPLPPSSPPKMMNNSSSGSDSTLASSPSKSSDLPNSTGQQDPSTKDPQAQGDCVLAKEDVKSPTPNCMQPPLGDGEANPHIQGNGPTNEQAAIEDDSCKMSPVEGKRPQAKDSVDNVLNLPSSPTTSSASPIQNGPL
ncbi:hypothetical protein CHS0354_006739 [Potamilus streckersoni]|uniref:Uncharacterized protein n=1 Tax=Potamilus streckersoni TaxID=2493646 RepID=A0AAE0VH54_9BIVA|nr:hypothetical protein CHS0354_006739 [Potamilus streckersoni]